MNKLKTTMILSAGIATIGVTGIGVANTTSAMSGGTSTNSHAHVDRNVAFDAALSTALATKFNLDKTEIQTVIDGVRQDQKDAMLTKRLESLKQALTDGKISQEQYDYIVAALTQVDTLRDSLKDASSAERSTIMAQIESEFKDLRAWMKDQNLSSKLIGQQFGWDHHSHKDNHSKDLDQDDDSDRS